MKTELEIKLEIEKINKDIADTENFLKNEAEFKVDEQMAIEDLVYLGKKKNLLYWVLGQ